jgi:hypothetical protein
MPFADEGRLIARRLKKLGEGLLRPVKNVGVVANPIEMAVPSSEDGGPARGAYPVGAKAVVKPHTFPGDPVDVRGLVEAASITADGLRGVVVRHDEDDIGRGRGKGFFAGESISAEGAGQRGQADGLDELASFYLCPPLGL